MEGNFTSSDRPKSPPGFMSGPTKNLTNFGSNTLLSLLVKKLTPNRKFLRKKEIDAKN